jgi:hypothetical protein
MLYATPASTMHKLGVRTHFRSISNHPQELEEMITGPHFVVEERFAQALSTAFVCVTYSAGLPLLMPVAFVSFLLSYWVDKVRCPQPYHFYMPVPDRISIGRFQDGLLTSPAPPLSCPHPPRSCASSGCAARLPRRTGRRRG